MVIGVTAWTDMRHRLIVLWHVVDRVIVIADHVPIVVVDFHALIRDALLAAGLHYVNVVAGDVETDCCLRVRWWWWW